MYDRRICCVRLFSVWTKNFHRNLFLCLFSAHQMSYCMILEKICISIKSGPPLALSRCVCVPFSQPAPALIRYNEWFCLCVCVRLLVNDCVFHRVQVHVPLIPLRNGAKNQAEKTEEPHFRYWQVTSRRCGRNRFSSFTHSLQKFEGMCGGACVFGGEGEAGSGCLID